MEEIIRAEELMANLTIRERKAMGFSTTELLLHDTYLP